MECFCHKLVAQEYSHITESETAILKTWASWVESTQAHQAHHTTTPSEHTVVRVGRKRRRFTSTTGTSEHLPTLSVPSSRSVIPDQPRQQLSQAPALLSKSVCDLVKTYSCQIAKTVFETGTKKLDIQQGSGVFVRLYLSIEQSVQNIEAHQLVRRTCCYSFALLHQKGTSVDPIIKEIQNALPHGQNTVRDQVYNVLRIGEKWKTIIGDFASILNRDPHDVRGLLCLLGSASTWERAKPEDRQSALKYLYRNTDIRERTLQYTPPIQNTLDQLSLESSFVEESPLSLSAEVIMPRSDRSDHTPRAVLARRDSHSLAQSVSEASLAAASEVIPGSGGISSEDAKILLLLLSTLSTPDKVPFDLFRGAMPRRRWSAQGDIEEVNAVHNGLALELCSFLSDSARLSSAFRELDFLSAVLKNDDGSYTIDEAVVGRIRERLPADEHLFWRRQALVVVYRAIPWKYLDSIVTNTNLILPHFQHVSLAFQDCYETLTPSTRVDLALTLVEATRLSNMAWKHFAIDQAEIVSRELEDWYLKCCLASSRSLLSRIDGNMDRATSSISNILEGQVRRAIDRRMHSAIGQATIQRTLNYVQIEDLTTAKKVLEDWSPLDHRPSSIEQVTVFRKHMLFGRVLRFQGTFEESLAQLERAHKIAEQSKHLAFDEDFRDLTCDYADTLRELDKSSLAEHHLRKEITRREQNSIYSGRSLLELSLAEALFAQKRFEEAEALCSSIQTRRGLLKLEKLRLHVTMAKIRHVKSDNEGAFACWSEAMKNIRKFELTNGRTTRVILMSICDTLSGLGQTWLVPESLNSIASLDKTAKPGGIQYWIAGMRHWVDFLQSRSPRSRM